jgi:hypothetical protein
MKPVYDQTDLEYADYLEMLAGDLEEMGQDGTSADIYEAMRRMRCGRGRIRYLVDGRWDNMLAALHEMIVNLTRPEDKPWI